jgi:myo-inositol 2-dehydrogenase/D-chiro-inositol 1-dehydrogenase
MPGLLPDAVVCPSLDAAVNDVGPLDGLVIASSSGSQAEYVLAACRLGIPAVFVEKPLTMSIEQAQKVQGTLQGSQTAPAVQVGFHRRHDYCFRALRAQLERADSAVRSVHLISYDAQPPTAQAAAQGGSSKFAQEAGSLFVDFSTHDFDMLRWLTGDEFEVCTLMRERSARFESHTIPPPVSGLVLNPSHATLPHLSAAKEKTFVEALGGGAGGEASFGDQMKLFNTFFHGLQTKGTRRPRRKTP